MKVSFIGFLSLSATLALTQLHALVPLEIESRRSTTAIPVPLESINSFVHTVHFNDARELQQVSRELVDVKRELKNKPTITIWIHGTRPWAFKTIFKSKGAFFLPATDTRVRDNLVSKLRALKSVYQRDNQDTFYALQWSGRLRCGSRERAARVLYNGISRAIAQHEQSDTQPFVRIITHSHGGNIALELVDLSNRFATKWCVDELILLACPVQGRTKQAIHAPKLTRIYSFCSSEDRRQLADPQGLSDPTQSDAWFSGRQFPHNKKLSQVRIQRNGTALRHSDFSRPWFIKLLPICTINADAWKSDQPTESPTAWDRGKKTLNIVYHDA